MDSNNIIDRILTASEQLQQHYWQRIDSGDPKATSGVESCLELEMKLLAIVTKPDIVLTHNPPQPSQSLDKSLDLSKLSDQALTEIYELLNIKSSK